VDFFDDRDEPSSSINICSVKN